LGKFKTRPTQPQPFPEQRPVTEVPANKPAAMEVLPPVEILSLPLFAFDNTCDFSDTMDISACTHALSGSAARIYNIRLEENQSLYVTVEPRSDFFDAGIAVFKDQQICIAGKDENGSGIAESLKLKNLSAGNYRVVVAGYHDDCGPYELTVRTEQPPIAEIKPPSVHSGPNGTVISWQTFGEVDLAHFVLYRTDGNNRLQIGSLRSHGNPAATTSYRFIDRKPAPNTSYEVVAVAHDGRTEEYTTRM
jgi:hypothetical protein